ncbi:MAG: pantetheine-phosphate adenylyltransferase [Oscillospiraceae bacterium]|nr:pantetheine-phosphate adenylyltransferase [Oscillospiraceae bacterium]
MKTAVYPGSFDPITNGHMDILTRSCGLFDKVYILVSDNPDKRCFFSTEERVSLISDAASHLKNAEIAVLKGLLADFVSKANAQAIVRGLRAVSDFEYEFQMALANRELNPKAETVFLSANSSHTFLSSSLVRQIASLGGNIAPFVPDSILSKVMEKFGQSS